MRNYNCYYNSGKYNCINDNIRANSAEEAKQIFIQKWGVAFPELVRVG